MTVLDDLRFIVRSLPKQPGLTATIVAVLAVGLAFNIATASLVNGLLRHPYRFPALDDLVVVRDSRPPDGLHQRNPIASGDFVDLRRESRTLERLSAWRPASLVMTDSAGEPAALQAVAVTGRFFDVLGVQPARGRTFGEGEDQAGRDRVVVVSHRWWTARLGGDPSAIGRPLTLDGAAVTLIGVIADEDGYPAGVDAWVPLVLSRDEEQLRGVQRLSVIGRVRPGASAADVRGELDGIGDRLARLYPATNRQRGFALMPLRAEQYEFTATFFLVVQTSALLVLALAIANAANLLVARTIDRRLDFAVRGALGATSRRVTSLVMGEALVLASVAAAAALPVSVWAVRVIRVSLPPDYAKWIAGWQAVHVDGTIAVVAGALAMVSGLVTGGAMAMDARRAAAGPALSDTGRAHTPRVHRLRRALIVVEVCLMVVLTIVAAGIVGGFRHVSAAFDALRPADVLAFSLSLPESRYPDAMRVTDFDDRLLTAVSALPQVASAALVRNAPASNVATPSTVFAVAGEPPLSPGDAPRADLQVVTPGAFTLLGVRTIAGRALLPSDRATTARVAVISQAMARRFWPRRDPVGGIIRLSLDRDAADIRIVGVMDDLRINWFDPDVRSVIYLPAAQMPLRQMFALVRTRTDPAQLARPVRDIVTRLDPRQSVGSLRPFDEEVRESIAPVRMMGVLLALAAGLAAILAASGIYAVLAHWVAQRRRELGVRSALGASAGHLVGLVLREGLVMAAAGVVVAIPVALLLANAVSRALPVMPPADALVVAAVALSAIVMTALASVAPASRAAATDPSNLMK